LRQSNSAEGIIIIHGHGR